MTRKWFAVQDQLFERLMSQVPVCRSGLREMAAADGGPVLDLSVGSLEPLSVWATEWARREPDDGEDWLPVSFNQRNTKRYVDWDVLRRGVPLKFRTRNLSPQAARMRQRIEVYLGDVMMGLVEGSRWVCWRGETVVSRQAGYAVVDVGNPEWPFNAGYAAGYAFMPGYGAFYDPSNPDYVPPEPRGMADFVELVLERLGQRREKGLGPVFQAAPTGPEAAAGRRPYAGRRGIREK
jgi:hypothetical protein